MALFDDPLLAFYLLLALVVMGYLAALSLKARRSGAAPAEAGGTGPAEARAGEDLLLQFVEDREGKRYGETVAVDGDRLIIKDGPTFYSAPLASFEQGSGSVVVAAAVDWEAARTEGEAWRERSHKVITYTDEELPKDAPPEP